MTLRFHSLDLLRIIRMNWCFPFRRYQIQNVWRADRPQHGRFQEFTQCDADIVGEKSLYQEIEMLQLYDSVFTKLGLEGDYA